MDPVEKTILEIWGIDAHYLTRVIRDNPSLRGMIVGYIAETKLRDIFKDDPRVTNLRKDDDHDRVNKGDLVVTYKGHDFRFEVKSLQTNSIEVFGPSGAWIKRIVKKDNRYMMNPSYKDIPFEYLLEAKYRGGVQCDASDRRKIKIPGHGEIETTCLLVGEFHILAAGAFGFREKWDFGFALNQDLPRSTHKAYPEEARKYLLKSMVPITWPLSSPFVTEPFSLMDRLLIEKSR